MKQLTDFIDSFTHSILMEKWHFVSWSTLIELHETLSNKKKKKTNAKKTIKILN